MTLVAKDDTINFVPHPEGQVRAVCVDVVDLGMVDTTFQNKSKKKHKCRIVFQTEAKMEDGKPFLLMARYTVSLNEKGWLRPFLESWRGKSFDPEELKGFDLETLIGVNAVVQVVHKKEGEKTYANISAIMKPMKGMKPLQATDYVRVKDRTDDNKGAYGAESGDPVTKDAAGDDDEEVPF